MNDQPEPEVREAVPVNPQGNGQKAGPWRFDMMLVGLFLIALGGLLLASTMNQDFDLREFVVTWWPGLLIAAGLVKIVQALTGVSGHKSGLGWLVFAIIMLMIFVGTPWDSIDLGDSDVHIFGWGINKLVKTDTKTIPLENATELRIDARRARIWVYGADVNQIEVTQRISVRGWGSKGRETEARGADFSFTRDESSISLLADSTRFDDRGRIYMELEIRVPKTMNLNLRGDHSRLFARGLSGTLVGTNAYADVEFSSIGGLVTFTSNNGDVDLRDLSGGLVLRGSRLDVNLEEIGGAVDVQVERSSIDLENYRPLSGPVTMSTSRAGIEVKFSRESSFDFEGRADSGNIDFEFGDVEENQRGEFRRKIKDGTYRVLLTTAGGSIEVDES